MEGSCIIRNSDFYRYFELGLSSLLLLPPALDSPALNSSRSQRCSTPLKS